MFQGSAALNLDAKGRMTIPTKHRDALARPGDGRLVVTAHPHKCLLLYPEPAWEPIRDKILAASSLEPQAAKLRRMLVGMASETEIDAAGRVLLSPELRAYAGLEKEVFLVGLGHHFEIWSGERWKALQEDFSTTGDQLLPPGLETLAL